MPEPKMPKEKETKEIQAPAQAQPALPDPYMLWLQNNPVLKPDEAAIYIKGDDRIVVFLDGMNKPVLNVGLHISKELLSRLTAKEAKPAEKKADEDSKA
jgi:hypothetical protein